MRPFLLLIILLFITKRMVVAQDAADCFLHITHLPPGGIVLDTGWKYTASDDPVYASTGYNDNGWPTLHLYQPPQPLLTATKTGTGKETTVIGTEGNTGTTG